MHIRFLCLALMASSAAGAARVDVQVRSSDGRPVADAVVMLDNPNHDTGPVRFPWPYVMRQQNITFVPHVLIVPVGANVSFPNLDKVRHHVYSFSKAKKFELKLYGQDDTRSVVFDKPGVIAVGCNIHDMMSGFILVVDTPYVGKTDATGHAIVDAPPGAMKLSVWHPKIRAAGNILAQPLSVPAAGLALTVPIG